MEILQYFINFLFLLYMLIILFIVIVTIVTIVVRHNKLKNGEYDYLFKEEQQQENVVVQK